MHIGIITYQRGHLKTFQLLLKLQTKSFRVSLYAFPFFLRPSKKKAFEDRPNQLIDIDIKAYCVHHDIRYVEINGWDDVYAHELGLEGDSDVPDVYLTCIAKIIPKSFIDNRIIVNAHPGLLPENRGLDAFKWAIVNIWPVGVSLHVIDEHIDRGILLHRVRVPILPNDQLRDVANRAYEIECDLMANSDYYLPNLSKQNFISDTYPLSKRNISDDVDRRLEDIFIENREALVNISSGE